MLNKKAQAANTDLLQTFLLSILGVAIVLVVGLIVLGELQTASLVSGKELTATPTSATATEAITSLARTPVTTIAMGIDELYAAQTSLMPTASFSKNISGALIGNDKSHTSEATWLIWDNVCNTTLSVINNTGYVPANNFTFVWVNKAAGEWGINWTDNHYNTTVLDYNCNRTFTAGKDNLLDTATINPTKDTEDFVIENTPADYGDDKTFYVDDSISTAGAYINKTAWTLTYTKTTRTWSGGTTTASNATGSIITKLATVPTWVGIIIVVALAFVVLGLFYMRRGNF